MPMSLAAQGGRAGDRVLYPYKAPCPIYVGLEGGYGWWTNSGNFVVADGDRTCVAFGASNGEGRTFGAKAMIYATPWFFVSPRVRQEMRSGKATISLPGEPVRDRSNAIVELRQEGRADIQIAALALEATAGVEFFGVYVFGGASVSFMGKGTYDYSERLIGPAGIVFGDTRTSEHTLIRNRPFDRYESSTFDLRGGGGYLLSIGRFVINPEVFYSTPLTSALKAPEEFKQTGVVATLGIMYNLGE